jgi:hypothetical protein
VDLDGKDAGFCTGVSARTDEVKSGRAVTSVDGRRTFRPTVHFSQQELPGVAEQTQIHELESRAIFYEQLSISDTFA